MHFILAGLLVEKGKDKINLGEKVFLSAGSGNKGYYLALKQPIILPKGYSYSSCIVLVARAGKMLKYSLKVSVHAKLQMIPCVPDRCCTGSHHDILVSVPKPMAIVWNWIKQNQKTNLNLSSHSIIHSHSTQIFSQYIFHAES